MNLSSLSSFFTIQFNSTNSHHNLIKSPLKLSPFPSPIYYTLLSFSITPTTILPFLPFSPSLVEIFQEIVKMNRRNGPKIDLKLNLSAPPRPNNNVESPNSSPSNTSPTSSCVSSDDSSTRYSPEGKSMMLVGCPRCLMYVMLAEEDPKCPKCKSTVLLDVIHDENNNNSSNNNNKKNKNKKN